VHVLVIGDIITDILAVHSGPLAVGSDTSARVRITGGGSAANTAAWLATALVPVAMAGVAGDDEAGSARVAELTGLGVTCHVRRVPDTATGSVVVLSGGTDRTMLCDRAANALLAPSDVDAALATAEFTHLHLSGYVLFDDRSAPAGRHALEEAAERGMTTSVDAASAAPLGRVGADRFLSLVRGTDVLFANFAEAQVLCGLAGNGSVAEAASLAGRLLGYAGSVVVKSGVDGAVWAGRDEVPVAVPAEPAHLVDPTGAGDAFAAGYLATWLAGKSPAEALAAGARLGALAVSRVGGRP
jgi:ribokinase